MLTMDLLAEKFHKGDPFASTFIGTGLGVATVAYMTKQPIRASSMAYSLFGASVASYLWEKMKVGDLSQMRAHVFAESKEVYADNIWHRAQGELFRPKNLDVSAIEKILDARDAPRSVSYDVDEEDLVSLLMRSKISGYKTIVFSDNTRHVRSSFLAQIGKPFLSETEHKCLKQGKVVHHFKDVIAPHNVLETMWRMVSPPKPFLLDIVVKCPAGQNPEDISDVDPHGDVSIAEFIKDIRFEAEDSKNTTGSFVVNIRSKKTDQ